MGELEMTPQDEIAKYGYQSYADPRSAAELRQAGAICDVYCNNCEKLIGFVEKPVRRDSLRCQTCGCISYSITIVDICDPAYVKRRKGKGWLVYTADCFLCGDDIFDTCYDYDPYCCGGCGLREEGSHCGYDKDRDGPLCPFEIEAGDVFYEED